MTESTHPAGWYPDSQHPGFRRYYDGSRWTDDYLDAAGNPARPTPAKRSGSKTPIIIVGVVVLLGIASIFGGGDEEAPVAEDSAPAVDEPAQDAPEEACGIPLPAPALATLQSSIAEGTIQEATYVALSPAEIQAARDASTLDRDWFGAVVVARHDPSGDLMTWVVARVNDAGDVEGPVIGADQVTRSRSDFGDLAEAGSPIDLAANSATMSESAQRLATCFAAQ